VSVLVLLKQQVPAITNFSNSKFLSGGRAGAHIGRYRLIGLLATGGMAEIYLALSGELSGFRTVVVVKRILPHLSENAQFIDMFFDEARIVARLDHPNIARVIEVGHDGDEYFLVMEVVQGKPLSAVLRGAARQGRPLTQALCGHLVAQAANALAYAHDLTDADGNSLGLVHRDVSPQNILVSFEGVVKVIDFGVARAMGRVTETIPGGLKGKIQYMSPEQVVGRPVDRRSDVFALGVVLWEALCGRRLFRRDTEMDTLSAIVEDPIPAPSSITRVSPRLERIVMQALEKDPDKRFQNAADMALALERHAFASEGFSPGQVATAMKALFPAELARWRRTMGAAIEREGAPETWTNAAGSFGVPQAIEGRTSGATVVLRPGTSGEDETERWAPEHRDLDDTSVSEPPSERAATPSTELHWLVAPPEPSEPVKESSEPQLIQARSDPAAHRDPPFQPDLDGRPPTRRGWNFAVAAGLALAGLLAGWLTSQYFNPLVGERVVALPEPMGTVVAPSSLAVEPGAGTQSIAIAPVPAPPAPASVMTAPAPSPTAVVPAEAAVSPESAPRGGKRKARSHRRRGKGRDVTEAHALVEPSVGVAAPSVESVAPPTDASMSEAPAAGVRSDGLAADARCVLKLGSQPWAEIWIDGKNTKSHTPYSEEIACGSHELTLVSHDPELSKTVTVALKAGQVYKRSFVLAEP